MSVLLPSVSVVVRNECDSVASRISSAFGRPVHHVGTPFFIDSPPPLLGPVTAFRGPIRRVLLFAASATPDVQVAAT